MAIPRVSDGSGLCERWAAHIRRERSGVELQQTLRDCEYLIRLNRLRQILVRSKADRTLAIVLCTFGRDHADRYPRKALLSANQADELQPIHDRHIDVHEGQVEMVTGDLPEAVHAILRFHDLDTLRSPSHRECSDAPIVSARHSFLSTSLGGDAIELVHNEVRLRTNLFADALAKKCAGFLNF